MENTENTIETKMITDIKMRFFIPAYQRGFRWTRQEVCDLLSDLSDFNSQNHTQKYCLQPVVVREMSDGQWEVIDGQQRLTTIFIFFKIAEGEIKSAKAPFELEYETRPGSAQFLQNLCEGSIKFKNENLDYFYMENAWQAMKDWLGKQKDYSESIIDIYQKLTKDTQIIWYQINDKNSEPVDIFTKINLGKIPLTNSELIKALFLNQENFTGHGTEIRKRQLEISGEWERIEQSLQEDSFWMFLVNDGKNYDTRIDFIFNLLAAEKNAALHEVIQDKQNKYFAFLVFDRLFKECTDAQVELDKLWEEIGRYHAIFKEWYRDSRLYHLIGYLVATGISADNIKLATAGKKKSEIEKYLKDQIKSGIKKFGDLKDLTYSETKHREKIRSVLLLFNIITLINHENSMRFPFDLYKKQQWDIEHIHSIAARTPETSNSRKEWLEERKKELMEKGIDPEEVSKINAFINENGTEDISKYENFCDDLNRKYGDLLEDVNDISNLTLLDATINRSYKNAFFPVKRMEIIERDKDAVFIPVCTKNVFLKLYSKAPENMRFWGEDDRGDYFKAMSDMLAEYFSGGSING